MQHLDTSETFLQPSEHHLQQQLLRLQTLHSQLAQGLSHDARAPLRAMTGYTRRLQQHPGLDAQAQQQLTRIQSSSERVAQLLDTVVQWLRIDTTELKPQQVDISFLAEWTAADLAQTRTAPMQWHIQDDLHAWGDERQYKLLLEKLLENAWQFAGAAYADTPAAPTAQVQVSGDYDENWLILRISDNGIGFDHAYVDKLFAPFQRLHGERQGAGAGLGLAIAEAIVIRHHGQIRADTSQPAGCCIEIKLPLRSI